MGAPALSLKMTWLSWLALVICSSKSTQYSSSIRFLSASRGVLLTRVWLLINRFAIVSTYARQESAPAQVVEIRGPTYGVEDGQLGNTSGACREASSVSMHTCTGRGGRTQRRQRLSTNRNQGVGPDPTPSRGQKPFPGAT